MNASLTHEIESLEKEVMEKAKKLHALRRQLPPEPVEDVELLGPTGPIRLSRLFGRHEDLLIVHNMGKSCPYCTLWADGLNGMVDHIESRTAFFVVSPDPPEEQKAFAAARGWRFRMLSDGDSGFTKAMGYVNEEDGKTQYWPGFSTFRKREDGSVVRIAHGYFGPGDLYCSVWHLFEHLDGGTGEWQPRFTY
jgi:predicted dithiol-disulfide oxidoreductase (DUF899 family)